ncbi:hypothetical protein H0H81_006683 [Sphagnurus paluster]|uniref:Uncharacterized protein n=1 Tax=Sphagnurus paluster TaxID=117069 RepID=A0A9P7FTL4_9AGAR|nr:hypothetical protein H0H81_006683 [Sphagnurus paluster]
MSTILVETRLPTSILIISRVSAYAHLVTSIMAALILWLCPSITPNTPVRVVLPTSTKLRSATVSSHKSTTTLVASSDADANDVASLKAAPADLGEELVEETPAKFTNPFCKGSPMRMAMSPTLSLHPFARRISMPARRLSHHITTTLGAPFHAAQPLEIPEADSYFSIQRPSLIPTDLADDGSESETESETESMVEAELVESEVQKAGKVDRAARMKRWIVELNTCGVEAPPVAPLMAHVPSAPRKEVSKLRRAARKARTALRRVRRHF